MMRRVLLTEKLHHEHGAEIAMLAYRTGLSATICKAWIDSPVAKSAKAIKAAFMPDSDDDSISAARSEIEAYALARVKKSSARVAVSRR
jgi:hypothetical protein